MKITIFPYDCKGKRVSAPPSKSQAHRALICSGLAEGKSHISNIAMSDDILATIDCLRALGAEIECDTENMTAEVSGAGSYTGAELLMPCRESGSTLRFMIPICAVSGAAATLTGSPRLMERPISIYEKILNEQGVIIEKTETSLRIEGTLKGGEFHIPGNISSQFVSGLLFALPLCGEDSILRITEVVESKPYIDMTIEALREHGVRVDRQGDSVLEIPGRQRYKPADIKIEGDWSNAANLIAIGATVEGLKSESSQGDRFCIEMFHLLDEGTATLDISDCPDLAPILMAYAALRHGCILHGTKRLRYKESDRGEAMRTELAKAGVRVLIDDDSIKVGCGVETPAESFYGHNDHRIVMAMSAICLRTGGSIEGAEAVRKSFPDYFDRLAEMGVTMKRDIC
ncbi:MAG: 3-phosphoshikimate 1-carboxyvinyltransferase [Mogibacterium sp.]|nr:3-phosphoshikimate 1-carboxyvinyltransferase [Mogibacterium sp.]